MASLLTSKSLAGFPKLSIRAISGIRRRPTVVRRIGEACADAGLQASERFINETFQDNRGITLYLQPAWELITSKIDSLPVTGNLEAFAEEDVAVTDAGEIAIKEMWSKLGLTFDEYADRSFYIFT